MSSKDKTTIMRTASEALKCKNSSSSKKNDNKGRQTPLMNRVYFYRTSVMNLCIDLTYNAFNAVSNKSPCMLILGAGLDTSLDKKYNSNDTNNIVYVVDYPEILQQRKDTGAIQVPCDLNQSDLLITQLQQTSFFNEIEGRGVIVVLECVLSYLTLPSADDLLKKLSSQISSSSTPLIVIAYDPLLPSSSSNNNSFASSLLKLFSQRGAPLHTLPTTTQQIHRYHSCGYQYSSCMTMLEMTVTQPTIARSGSNSSGVGDGGGDGGMWLEPFDEHAALALTQNHYGITIATTTGNSDNTDNNTDTNTNTNTDIDKGNLIHTKIIDSLFGDYDMSNINTTTNTNTNVNVNDVTKIQRTAIKNRLFKNMIPTNTTTTDNILYSNDDELIIEEAVVQDITSIFNLLVEGFSKVSELYPCVRKFLKSAKGEIARSPSRNDIKLLVARTSGSTSGGGGGGVIVGCVGIQLRNIDDNSNSNRSSNNGSNGSGSDVDIKHMAVHHTCRRRGLGRRLLSSALELIPSLLSTNTTTTTTTNNTTNTNDIKITAHLSVVSELTAARSLYSSVGFKSQDTQTFKDGCILHHYIKSIEL